MTEKFINLKDNRISINPWRDPAAQVCCLDELLVSMEDYSGKILVCSISGVVDALQDGEYLSKINVSQDTIEHLFNIINREA